MTSVYTVRELLDRGASQTDLDIAVTGWVWDRFEHRAIYESLTGIAKPDPQVGIWLRGQLPRRRTIRGDGPLHRVQVRLTGRLHWRPKAGAGHGSLWPAWIGVRMVEIITAPGAES
jgi:hypothetical protein